jgi:hypothetical protein
VKSSLMRNLVKGDQYNCFKKSCRHLAQEMGLKFHVAFKFAVFMKRNFIIFFLRRPNLFAICNNTFSKWWESVKDGL